MLKGRSVAFLLFLAVAAVSSIRATQVVGRTATEEQEHKNLTRRFLAKLPPGSETKLIEVYRKMAEERRTEAAGAAKDLQGVQEALSQIGQSKQASQYTWARLRSSNLEKKRAEGMDRLAQAEKEAKEAALDAVGQKIVLGTAKAFSLKLAEQVGEKAFAINDVKKAEKEKKLLQGAASAADLVFGGEARAAVDLAIVLEGVAHGGSMALSANRQIARLKPLREQAVDFEISRMVLPKEREDLAYRLNGLMSQAKQYEDIAAKLERGDVPDDLPLSTEVQEVLWPHHYNMHINPPPPPNWLRKGEPGGIKFSLSELDSSIFQLDLNSLYFDASQGNLVLIGNQNPSRFPIDSDLLASALLLAAQGGDPWFSLDAVNIKEWDTLAIWSGEEVRRNFTNGELATRFLRLRNEGKVVQRESADGRLALYATLEALDPGLYARLRREKEIGVHLAFSHEFLRYTEAGRILFEADKALKDATQGRTIIGDAVRPTALNTALSDKMKTGAGRGDFAPMVQETYGPAGIVGINDLSVRLELTARIKGRNVDDKVTRVEAYEEMMARFNGNQSGVRDRIMDSTYSIGQLRQFYKAYFAAKALMEREPGLRALVMASVQVPVRDCLPDVYYEPPVIEMYVCPEFLNNHSCSKGHRVGVGALGGFGGGISFMAAGPNAPVIREAQTDHSLRLAAAFGREVARNSGPGLSTRDGQTFIRVSLFPELHVRSLGEIDLTLGSLPEVLSDPPLPTGRKSGTGLLAASLAAIVLVSVVALWTRARLNALAAASVGLCEACRRGDQNKLLLRAMAWAVISAAIAFLAVLTAVGRFGLG